MDPLTTAIMTVLGKFVADKGASIAQEVGEAAAKVGGEIFDKVMSKLKSDQRFSWLVEQFKQAGGASLVASNVTATTSGEGSTAVGAFQVGGNLSGNVQIGGTSTTTNRSG